MGDGIYKSIGESLTKIFKLKDEIMKKILLALISGIALTACNNSSSDTKEEVQETQEVTVSLETTKLEIQLNLPSGINSPVIDTQNFTPDDMLSYNASTGTYVCDPEGNQKLLDIYLLRVENNKWDIYFRLDDEMLNIEGGEIGGAGQNKATIEFDEAGNFIRQVPYILNSTELQYPEKNYNIEFDFYSYLTTNFDEPFTVKNLNANGC